MASAEVMDRFLVSQKYKESMEGRLRPILQHLLGAYMEMLLDSGVSQAKLEEFSTLVSTFILELGYRVGKGAIQVVYTDDELKALADFHEKNPWVLQKQEEVNTLTKQGMEYEIETTLIPKINEFFNDLDKPQSIEQIVSEALTSAG